MLIDLISLKEINSTSVVDVKISNSDTAVPVTHLNISGNLSINKSIEWFPNEPLKINSIFISVGKAPAGSDIVIEILKGVAGKAVDDVVLKDGQNFVVIDGHKMLRPYINTASLIFTVKQVGTTHPGRNLQIQIVYEKTNAQTVADRVLEENTQAGHYRMFANGWTRKTLENNIVFDGYIANIAENSSTYTGNLDIDILKEYSSFLISTVGIQYVPSTASYQAVLKIKGRGLSSTFFDSISITNVGQLVGNNSTTFSVQGNIATWVWSIQKSAYDSIVAAKSFILWLSRTNLPTLLRKVYPENSVVDGSSFVGHDADRNLGGIWNKKLPDGSLIKAIYAQRQSGVGSVSQNGISNLVAKIENVDGRNLGAIFYPSNLQNTETTVLSSEAAVKTVDAQYTQTSRLVKYVWDYTKETPQHAQSAPPEFTTPYNIDTVDVRTFGSNASFFVASRMSGTIKDKGYVKYASKDANVTDMGSISITNLPNGVPIHAIYFSENTASAQPYSLKVLLGGNQTDAIDYIEIKNMGRYYLRKAEKLVTQLGDTSLTWYISNTKYNSVSVGANLNFVVVY